MTRFKKAETKFDCLNIRIQDIEPLRIFFKREIKQKHGILNSVVKNFVQNAKKSYKVYEPSDSMVMVLRKRDLSKIYINIGYPFPIYKESINPGNGIYIPKNEHLEIDLYYRGNIVREFQRKRIKSFLKEKCYLRWCSVKDIDKFRSLASSLINQYSTKPHSWVYIDPYEFIGDSVTGLHFSDRFITEFGIEKMYVLSRFSKHLEFFFESIPKKVELLEEVCQESNSTILIMPDLVDNHLSNTLRLLEVLLRQNALVMLLGRNILIRFRRDCNTAQAFHLLTDDVLLRNKSIEEYMDDCLTPFMIPTKPLQNLTYGRTDNESLKIFVHPHSSHFMKAISPELTLRIISEMIENVNGKVYISKGVKDQLDVEWITSSMQLLLIQYRKIAKRIDFLEDSGLSDLCHKLIRERISAALVADTGVAHVLSRMFIPNITIWNSQFWDSESTQSLSAESVLGFCRFNFPQYPAVMDKNTNMHLLIASISKGLIFLSKNSSNCVSNKLRQRIANFASKITRLTKKHANDEFTYAHHQELNLDYLKLQRYLKTSCLDWTIGLYNPDEVVKGILDQPNERISPLLRSAWRILPIFKLFSLANS